MIEKTGARVAPADALLHEIEKRRSSFAVQASGLAPVLEMLSAYITLTESRIAELERAQAKK